MIPPIVTQALHDLLATKIHPPTQARPPSASGKAPPVGGAIAGDLGQLTADTLSLFGVGGATGGSPVRVGMSAYAMASDLAG